MKKKKRIPPHACYYKLRPHSEAGAFDVVKCEICGKPKEYLNASPTDFSPQEWEKLTAKTRHKAGSVQIRPWEGPTRTL